MFNIWMFLQYLQIANIKFFHYNTGYIIKLNKFVGGVALSPNPTTTPPRRWVTLREGYAYVPQPNQPTKFQFWDIAIPRAREIDRTALADIQLTRGYNWTSHLPFCEWRRVLCIAVLAISVLVLVLSSSVLPLAYRWQELPQEYQALSHRRQQIKTAKLRRCDCSDRANSSYVKVNIEKPYEL